MVAQHPAYRLDSVTVGTHGVDGPHDQRLRGSESVNLGQTTAYWLAKYVDQDGPAALSIAGMLHLRTAIAAAHRQDRSTTTALLAAADQAATRLGRDADYWQTSFGPTNVQLHRVAAGLDLGDVAWVVKYGSQIDTSRPPAERSVAQQVDLARA